jgi:tRNA threonylcarbamoyladenosine modification (KEOPS) complex  Pcc1 subunit
MTDAPSPWRATVTVRAPAPSLTRALERALRPEVSREVPRARAELHAAVRDELVLAITASDAGAMRAALNTYLGWIHLAAATARTAEPRRSGAEEATG